MIDFSTPPTGFVSHIYTAYLAEEIWSLADILPGFSNTLAGYKPAEQKLMDCMQSDLVHGLSMRAWSAV